MTVKQLMNKLKKMPEDAVVVIPNTNHYFDGEYKATQVTNFTWEKGEYVAIETDYKKALWTD